MARKANMSVRVTGKRKRGTDDGKDPRDRVNVKMARKTGLAPLRVDGWRNAKASDIAGPAWPKRDRTFCCWDNDEQYEMWREVLAFRGWRYAGPLCDPDHTEHLKDIALGKRKPRARLGKHCLYITSIQEEIRMLCARPGSRGPHGAKWKLPMFRGMQQAVWKRATAAQMKAIKASYFPETYTLPHQRDALRSIAAKARAASKSGRVKPSARSLWIAKPHDGYAGKGMVVFDAASPEFAKFLKSERSAHYIISGKASRKEGTSQQKDTVVQRYIANPLLLGGYKFHMRAYILVTRLLPDPVAFVHRDVQMMTTVKPFSLAPSTFGKTFDPVVHITNDAIQFTEKNAEAIVADKPVIGRGGFMDASQFETHIEEIGLLSREELWRQILTVCGDVVKGIAKSPEIAKCSKDADSRHFEMLGCDLLLDSKGKVWLLEVNDSPGVQPEKFFLFDGKPLGKGGVPLENADKITCDGGMWRLLHDTVALLGLDGSVCAGRATAKDANISRFWSLFS